MGTVINSFEKVREGRTENGCYWQYVPRGKGAINFTCKNISDEKPCACHSELRTALQYRGERSGCKF